MLARLGHQAVDRPAEGLLKIGAVRFRGERADAGPDDDLGQVSVLLLGEDDVRVGVLVQQALQLLQLPFGERLQARLQIGLPPGEQDRHGTPSVEIGTGLQLKP